MARRPIPGPAPDPGPFRPGPGPGPQPFAAPYNAELRVRRPRDGLIVDIVLRSFRRMPGAPQITSEAAGTSRIILLLPPQHIGEGFVTAMEIDGVGKKVKAINAKLSGNSRLVFRVPPNTTLPLTAAALLAECLKLPLAINLKGQTAASSKELLDTAATFIEAPYGLALSPDGLAGFVHGAGPLITAPRAALWHSRLIPARVASVASLTRAESRNPASLYGVAALPSGDANPLLGGISPSERGEIVKLTRDFPDGTQGKPASARRLVLTPLGASFDIAASWPNPPQGISLVDWAHRASIGRDNYVRVVTRGYLAPFGHAAVLIKVTERVTHDQGGTDGWIAVLRQTLWLVVTQPRRVFTAHDPAEERRFPFGEVELLTLITPLQPTPAFEFAPRWIQTSPWSKTALPFDIVATDKSGASVRFRMPLVFAPASAFDPKTAMGVLEFYKGAPPPGLSGVHREPDLGSAPIVLAPGNLEKSTLPVQRIKFGMKPLAKAGERYPFAPWFETVTAAIPGGEEFAGGRKTGVFSFPEADYIANGLKSQGVFLAVPTNMVPTKLFGPNSGSDTQATGGLLTPSMDVRGIATELGAFGGLPDQVAAGTFNAKEIFGDMKLLGFVPLAAIFPSSLASGLPKLTRAMEDGQISIGFKMERTSLTPYTLGPLTFRAAKAKQFSFKLESEIVVKATGGGSSKLSAALDNFEIAFELPDVGGVQVNFARLAMTIEPGAKPDLELNFADDPVVFTGMLGFVQKLMDIIPISAFSDPPDIDIGPGGVTAGYSLALPPLPLGALMLNNIGFGAAFTLPFVGGRPSLKLSFASREKPFGILVYAIGGGGYFAIETDTGGLVALEGALEAQAAIALNLGVAAGAVNIRLGIYFRYVLAGPTLTLEAFIEVHGEMSVLGLISVSITMHIGLRTVKEDERIDLFGTATIEVEIEFCFFSKTVGVSCTRQFAGSNADPGFAEIFPNPLQWEQGYRAAFD